MKKFYFLTRGGFSCWKSSEKIFCRKIEKFVVVVLRKKEIATKCLFFFPTSAETGLSQSRWLWLYRRSTKDWFRQNCHSLASLCAAPLAGISLRSVPPVASARKCRALPVTDTDCPADFDARLVRCRPEVPGSIFGPGKRAWIFN